jgi:hypothetical protein
VNVIGFDPTASFPAIFAALAAFAQKSRNERAPFRTKVKRISFFLRRICDARAVSRDARTEKFHFFFDRITNGNASVARNAANEMYSRKEFGIAATIPTNAANKNAGKAIG